MTGRTLAGPRRPRPRPATQAPPATTPRRFDCPECKKRVPAYTPGCAGCAIIRNLTS